MRIKKHLLILLLLTFVFLLSSVAHAQVTDYSVLDNWLVQEQNPGQPVDVFYLLPTTYRATTDAEQFATIDNQAMRKRSARHLLNTIGVFSEDCNVFIPHYRQADALKILNTPSAARDDLMRIAPLPDVLAALDYYFENLNRGRPFILAGYSQGSYLMRFVLAEYFKKHPELQQRMIAAYAIGYAIDTNYLAQNPHLKFATAADDTGVIISFNVEAPQLTVDNPLTMPGSISINPITWTLSEKHASRKLSKGSLLASESGELVKVPHFADAQVNIARGTVVSSTINIDRFSPKMLGGVFPRGIYHGSDYTLYYFDIKANVQKRVQSYFQKLAQTMPLAS